MFFYSIKITKAYICTKYEKLYKMRA